MQQDIDGFILTPRGFLRGRVAWGGDGRIRVAEGEALDGTQARALAAETGLPLVLPGFIDSHVHGGGGRDIMEGGDAARDVARLHARHGTTALLATTMTAPREDLERALAGVAPLCRQRDRGARVLGVHLEGPFISPARLGAQPDFARAASLEEIGVLHALAPIRLITLAPERDGHLELIAPLRAAGFLVQIGHSAGSYEQGLAALEQGATGFTHLFNAMSGLHHREPGMVGVALAHARHAELIPDLLHVHPGALRVALRAIPRCFCVTDSTAAAGMPDGEYRLGRHRVRKCLGGVRLSDGRLAGSTLTMDQALRNLVGLGLSLEDASLRVSGHAAEYLGLDDRGRLTSGAWADLVVMDEALRLRRVIAEGEEIELDDA